MNEQVFVVSDRTDTNRAVPLLKTARGVKLRVHEVKGTLQQNQRR